MVILQLRMPITYFSLELEDEGEDEDERSSKMGGGGTADLSRLVERVDGTNI